METTYLIGMNISNNIWEAGEWILGRLIVLKNLPIMLCCTAPKIYLLCSTNTPIMLKLRIARVRKIMH